MKIGIACITYNRPKHLEFWTKMIARFSPEDAVFHIANDSKQRKGVAFRSNECLKDLYDAGCDYIFLFNDDCFPIARNWCQFFIDASNASGQKHFMYLHETPAVKKIDSKNGIDIYNACLGVMLFMTRECIEKVGGFSPNFSIYGFEHANYTNRIHQAGLTPLGSYSCPSNASEYIYSLDIDSHKPEWHKQLKHKSSMPAKEAMHHIGVATKIYQQENQLYYPL